MRQQRYGYTDEAVDPEFLEHTGVEHGRRRGSGSISDGGPAVKGPERNQDAKPDQQETKNKALRFGPQWLRFELLAQGDQIKGLGA